MKSDARSKQQTQKLCYLLSILASHALELSPSLITEINSSIGQKLTIRRHPLANLAVSLGQSWGAILKDNLPLAVVICKWLEALHEYLSYYRGSTLEGSANEACSLAVRRLFKLLKKSLSWNHSAWRERELIRVPALPDPSLSNLNKDLIPASRPCVRTFLNWTHRIKSGIRPLNEAARLDDSDLAGDDGDLKGVTFVGDEIVLRSILGRHYNEDRKKFTGITAQGLAANSAFTKMAGCATSFTPVAIDWFSRLSGTQSFSEKPIDELISTLLWLLELFYGIKAVDGANLGINDAGEGSSLLGHLTETEMHLGINAGRYRSARCWDPAVLRLPLIPEMREVLAELLRRMPGARRVLDFWRGKESFVEMHRQQTRAAIRRTIPDWKGRGCRLDRIWIGTALELGLPAALIGLLRGHPLGGARGASAYLSILHRYVVDAMQTIHRRLYEMCQLEYRPVAFDPLPNQVYGKAAISLRCHSERTLAFIKEARTFNELIACVVRLCRSLGFRALDLHYNPWLFHRTEPVILLEVRDKLMGEWVPSRYLPLSETFDALVRNLFKLFGDQRYLSYVYDGRGCFFHDLPEKEKAHLKGILGDEDVEAQTPGRVALNMALLNRKAGDLVCQTIVGHGSMTTHLAGNQLPIPPLRILEIAQEFMLEICTQEGLDACAKALIERLNAIEPNSVVRPAETNVSFSQTESLLEQTPRGIHRPMDYKEKCVREEVYGRLNDYQILSPGGATPSHRPRKSWPTHDAGLLGLIGLHLCIPLSHLLRFAPYFTYESFVWDHKSKRIFFQVTCGHHDYGGLAESLIEVCTFEEEARHPVMRLLRYKFQRGVERILYQQKRHDANTPLSREAAGLRMLKRPLFGDLLVRANPKRERTKSSPSAFLSNAVEQRRRVGDQLSFLFTREDKRIHTGLPAFKLLDRIAMISCSIWHAPLLAGVLCQRSLVGLNRYAPRDLLAALNRGPGKIFNILGLEWNEPQPLGPWKAPSQQPRERKPNFDTLKGSPQEWQKFLLREGSRAPNYREVVAELTCHKLPEAAARSMASRLVTLFRNEGKLSYEAPLSLMPALDLDDLITTTCAHITATFQPRAKKASVSRRTSRVVQQGSRVNAKADDIRHEHVQVLRVAHETEMRPNEILGLFKQDHIVVRGNGFLVVRDGKTRNAPRTIEISDELSGILADRRPSPGEVGVTNNYLFPNLRWHHKVADSAMQNLSRQLGKCAGREIKPYDLRHLGIVYAMAREIDQKLRSGNVGHALASLANKVGHGSLMMTFSTYVGGAYILFQGKKEAPSFCSQISSAHKHN